MSTPLPIDPYGDAHFGGALAAVSRNPLVHANIGFAVLVGVENRVVETSEFGLVADRTIGQHVKQIMSAPQYHKREECALHRKFHRTWSWYDSIAESGRGRVKRMQVKPGANFSLRKHRHRAEHWILVTWAEEISCGYIKLVLTENQSTYIYLGEVIRLANPGTIPLEIIELQSARYSGEDDVFRLEDAYERVRA